MIKQQEIIFKNDCIIIKNATDEVKKYLLSKNIDTNNSKDEDIEAQELLRDYADFIINC